MDFFDRNERFKLIWGFPGWSDGYGEDTKFVHELKEYQDIVKDFGMRRKKRGGPYDWFSDQIPFYDALTRAMRIDEDDLVNGVPSGYMQLYDLKGRTLHR